MKSGSDWSPPNAKQSRRRSSWRGKWYLLQHEDYCFGSTRGGYLGMTANVCDEPSKHARGNAIEQLVEHMEY